MPFKIDNENSVTSVGYFTSGAFTARDIVKQLTDAFENDWEVDSEPRSTYSGYCGDNFKITITVEEV